jgi:hypothetical protein
LQFLRYMRLLARAPLPTFSCRNHFRCLWFLIMHGNFHLLKRLFANLRNIDVKAWNQTCKSRVRTSCSNTCCGRLVTFVCSGRSDAPTRTRNVDGYNLRLLPCHERCFTTQIISSNRHRYPELTPTLKLWKTPGEGGRNRSLYTFAYSYSCTDTVVSMLACQKKRSPTPRAGPPSAI